MAVDVSLTALLDAGGAFLFVLEGIAILALSRGTSRGVLAGGFATMLGLTYVVENIFVYDGTGPTPAWLFAACAILAALLAVLLARHLALGLAQRAIATLFVLAATLVILAGAFTLVALTIFPDVREAGAVSASFATRLACVGLLAAIAAKVRSLPGEAGRERRALVFLALAVGLWTVFNFVSNIGYVSRMGGTLGGGIWLGTASLAMATVLAFSPMFRSHEPRLLARLVLALLAAAFAGLAAAIIFKDPAHESGGNGLVRTVGATMLALAVLRYDLLGVPLPRIAAKRGVIATAALATLFIVAQLAQNFLSAEYGLLTGGVIAGAVLFAANPVQKAIERATERKDAGKSASGGDVSKRREDVYLGALRLAMRDRTLTRDEEVHLHRLAEELGIGAGRAHELMVAVEAERPARRRMT